MESLDELDDNTLLLLVVPNTPKQAPHRATSTSAIRHQKHAWTESAVQYSGMNKETTFRLYIPAVMSGPVHENIRTKCRVEGSSEFKTSQICLEAALYEALNNSEFHTEDASNADAFYLPLMAHIHEISEAPVSDMVWRESLVGFSANVSRDLEEYWRHLRAQGKQPPCIFTTVASQFTEVIGWLLHHP